MIKITFPPNNSIKIQVLFIASLILYVTEKHFQDAYWNNAKKS